MSELPLPFSSALSSSQYFYKLLFRNNSQLHLNLGELLAEDMKVVNNLLIRVQITAGVSTDGLRLPCTVMIQ